MTTTNINWGSVNAFAGTVRVYTRQHWADSWTLVDNLWPTNLRWLLFPNRSIAEFRSDYGPILPTNDDTWTTVAKTNVLGYYVKVEVDCADGTLRWVGFMDDVVDYQGGVINNGVSDVPYGRLDITAYSMLSCLDYQGVHTSFWWDGTDKRESGSAIGFNAGGHPNRTATVPSSEASHLFSADVDAEYWSSKDIAEYLIAQHSPKNAAGSTAIGFELINASLLPDWDRPEIFPDRMTVWEVLEQLVDQRFFLVASGDYNTANNKVQVKIFSLALADVVLSDFASLPESTEKLTVQCVTDTTTQAIVQSSATRSYHRVRARGARRTSTATVGLGLGLEKDWDEFSVDAFNNAASGEPGYLILNLEAQREANKAMRAKGKMADTFQRLKIPNDFDWAITGTPIFQNDDGSQHYAFPNAIDIQYELPLLTGVDYDDDKIATGLDLSEAGGPRMPLVIAADPRYSSKWRDLANRFCISLENNSADPLQPYRALRISCFEDAVLTGGTEYVPLPADPIPDETYDLDTTNATLCFVDDRYAEGVEEAATIATADQIRELIVDLGDTYKLDYVVDGTVTNIAPDQSLDTTTEEGFLNDDREKLDAYAKLLGLWYLVPRNLLTIQTARPSSKAFPGQLCTTLNAGTAQATTINTVVTAISLSLPIGTDRPGVPQYTLQTAANYIDASIL